MAKKMNAKQRRETLKLERQRKYQKVEPLMAEDTEEAKPAEPQEKEKKIKTKKSSAKIAGVKSAFILSPNEVLMTSFGRGNEAVIEKYISDNEVTSINGAPAFEALYDGTAYALKGRKEGSIDDPLRFNEERASKQGDKIPQLPGMDILGLKPTLEKRFYKAGKECADNIHIQLIYNILDIEKILTPHINNIVYVINNLKRDGNPEDDFIGYMRLINSYKTFNDPENSWINSDSKKIENIKKCKESFDRLISMPQREYLGNALINLQRCLKLEQKRRNARDNHLEESIIKREYKYEDKEEDLKRYYYELCLIGELRQMLFHGQESFQGAIYQLGSEYDQLIKEPDTVLARKEAREVLDNIYESQINDLNNNFLDIAKRDLATIFKVYKAETIEAKKELVRSYYDFIVKKDQKNLGFSLKKLREIILGGKDGATVEANCPLSMKSKFVRNFDFASALYYQKHPEKIESMVEGLRASNGDEEQDTIYRNEADSLWSEIRSTVLDHILPVMNPDVFKKLAGDEDVNENMISDIAISTDADYFSKFIYMLTLFMDGKEINELITKLISKFESIDSFNFVLSERKLDSELSDEYAMFANSGSIAKELRIINSFARMQKESPNAKKAMFIEAAQILGFKGSDEDMNEYMELILTKDQAIKTDLLKKLKGLPKPNKGFSNFIANNVIESARFKYLVRYADPETVKEIARNDQVLKLVLNEIPDNQIARYYEPCVSKDLATPETMRDELRRIIKNLSFEEFAEVNQASNAERDTDKQSKQAIIRLYLTVLYLAVKNLVNINSRYTLAFHCFERDYQLFNGKRFDIRNKNTSYADLTNRFIEEKKLNKKSRAYLKTNIENSYDHEITAYRNNIAHLNVVRNIDSLVTGLKKTESYFALYHYLMQKSLLEKYKKTPEDKKVEEPITEEFFSTVEAYGKYRKDFVKALNIPFGYNLARYKNLSIDGLFDMNRPGDFGTGESINE